MDSARWQQVQALFHRALEMPESDRRAWLKAACGDDPDLLVEVQTLLDEDADRSLLDADLGEVASQVLDGAARAWPSGTFGPYRLVRVLGEGGMAVVYLAEREDLGSQAAIKVLKDAHLSPARHERFLSEQRMLAGLDHPSIARLFDAGTLPDGTPWFVMEHVDGVPLTTYCRTRKTSIPGRLELFRSVCEAVQHAHRHAVIHRDLKPSNIFVRADGTVKLLDFGLAKHVDPVEGAVDQTQTGQRFLTPAYAAPEQIRGERVGIHTDVYALGVVLYELLTDQLPFDLARATPGEALDIVIRGEPERLSSVMRRAGGAGQEAGRRVLPRAAWADLDVLCLTAMHQDPFRRYRTVDALIGDIDRLLEGRPLEARPDTLGYRLGKFVRRYRARVIGAAAAVVVFLGLIMVHTVRLSEQRSMARAEAAKATQISEYLISLFEAGDPFAAAGAETDVRTLLERGVERAETLADQPEIQAQVLDVLGRVHVRLSEYDRAEPLLRRALAIRTGDGASPLDAATTMMNLADLFRFAGSYDSAEAYARSALAIRKRHLPSTHPDLAGTLDGLGVVLSNKGEYEEAEVLQRRGLALRREIYDRPHELVAHSLNNLAVTLANNGNYDEAETYLHESITIAVAVLGPDHASLASDLSNLGVIRDIKGDYAGADSALSASLAIKRAKLGDLHWETAFTLTALGGMLRRAGQPERAESLLREALAIEAQVLEPDHRNTAITRTHLAALLQQRGEYAEAERLYHRAVEILRERLGDRHQFTATAQCARAHLLRQTRRLRESEHEFRECLAVLEDALPPGHDVLAGQQSRFGGLLTALGRLDEAGPLLRESYDVLRERFGEDHQDTRDAAARLAEWEQARSR